MVSWISNIMSWISNALADPGVIAAIVAFLTVAVVSSPVAFRLARIRAAHESVLLEQSNAHANALQAQSNAHANALQAQSNAHAKALQDERNTHEIALKDAERAHTEELTRRQAQHEFDLEARKSQLAEQVALRRLKAEARLAERERERARRRALIETLRELVGKIATEVPMLVSRTPADDEDVIRLSQRAFDLYGRVADVLRSLERSIRRSDFKKLEGLKGILAEICLDFARDQEERDRPERRERLERLIAMLDRYVADSEEAFERALVPWSEADPSPNAAALATVSPDTR